MDAITTGLTVAGRRPWLWLVPVGVDLLLWLVPRFSIAGLVARFLRGWEMLVRAAYTPGQVEAMSDMLRLVNEGMTMLAAQVNLLDLLAGSWFSPPSAFAAGQATRLNFISELILAPVGLFPQPLKLVAAPWQITPIEVRSLLTAMLLAIAAWLVAQVLAVIWLRTAAAALPRPVGQEGGSVRQGIHQVIQLTGFCVFLGMMLFALRLPMGAAVALLLLSGSALAGLVFAVVGGITLWVMLWLLLSLYFTGEGLLFERQPVWRSMLQGAALMRGNAMATLGLVALVNLLLVGFRAVWGLIGQTPVGVVIAILGNAYLATAMLLAIFTYYGGLRERWLAAQQKILATQQQATPKEEQ